MENRPVVQKKTAKVKTLSTIIAAVSKATVGLTHMLYWTLGAFSFPSTCPSWFWPEAVRALLL